MTTQEREELLKNLVAQLISAHHAHLHSARDEIDEAHEFWKAADALCDACDIGEIPETCRALFNAVYGDGRTRGFKAAWKDWSEAQTKKGNPDWIVPQAVWSAYDRVKQSLLRQVSRPRMIETVAELHEQGVTPQQIAEIYEWKLPSGAPDVRKVYDAIANPGKHDTEDARLPGKTRQQQQAEVWDEYARKLARSRPVKRLRDQLEAGIDPESPDAGSVQHEAAPRGPQLAFEDDEETPPFEASASGEIEMDDDVDVQSPEEQILEMVDQGLDDADIVERLGVTRQKVAAVKKRRDQIEQPA